MIERYYNTRVKSTTWKVGDLVLRRKKSKPKGTYQEVKPKLGRTILSDRSHRKWFICHGEHGRNSIAKGMEYVKPSQIPFLGKKNHESACSRSRNVLIAVGDKHFVYYWLWPWKQYFRFWSIKQYQVLTKHEPLAFVAYGSVAMIHHIMVRPYFYLIWIMSFFSLWFSVTMIHHVMVQPYFY